MTDDKREVEQETPENESGSVDAETPTTPPARPDPPVPVTQDTEKSYAGRKPYLLGAVAIILIVVIAASFFYLQRRQERVNEARSRLSLGRAALVDGDYYLSLFQLEKALALDPEIPGAHALLGQIAIVYKQGGNAVNHFNLELEIDPDDRTSHMALGCLYTLGCIPMDDPNQLRAYLLGKFPDVVPFLWPDDFVYTPGTETNPLFNAAYHFQFVLENLPDDPSPHIGLALTDIANFKLDDARKRLSGLLAETDDENILFHAYRIIEDINQEEQYRNYVASAPEPPQTTPPSEDDTASVSQEQNFEDYSLEPVPGLGNLPDPSTVADSMPGTSDTGGFGSRPADPIADGSTENDGYNLSQSISLSDLTPQPTVKPITNDIPIEGSGEWVHTVRIANIYQPGSVGFREGETIVMPNTNIEVTVVSATDEQIVLEERGNTFVWIPREVGWALESSLDESGQIPPGITVHSPDEDEQDESEVESEVSEEDEDSAATDEELGPEVSPA